MSVTLHHLNNSQSQRVLWLLEELNIPYEVVHHYRDPKIHLAPAELKKIHPLGRSPILVTSDGRAIAETIVIVDYLLRTYDADHKFSAADWIKEETLVSVGMSTLGNGLFTSLIGDIMASFKPDIKDVTDGIKTQILGRSGELVGWIQSELGDNEFFGGAGPTKADFMLSFPLEEMEHRKWAGVNEGKFPKIDEWLKRIKERPAYKKAIEKGNGYDFGVF